MIQAAISHSTIAPIPTRELDLRPTLRSAGLRLERDRSRYRIIRGAQVLLDRNPRGEPLSLEEVATFVNRALKVTA